MQTCQHFSKAVFCAALMSFVEYKHKPFDVPSVLCIETWLGADYLYSCLLFDFCGSTVSLYILCRMYGKSVPTGMPLTFMAETLNIAKAQCWVLTKL